MRGALRRRIRHGALDAAPTARPRAPHVPLAAPRRMRRRGPRHRAYDVRASRNAARAPSVAPRARRARDRHRPRPPHLKTQPGRGGQTAMDNQHRKIKGYRELTQAEVDLMNEVKEHGERTRELIAKCEAFDHNNPPQGDVDEVAAAVQRRNDAGRWRAIAKTHFQEGLMALTRSVAKPEFF